MRLAHRCMRFLEMRLYRRRVGTGGVQSLRQRVHVRFRVGRGLIVSGFHCVLERCQSGDLLRRKIEGVLASK